MADDNNNLDLSAIDQIYEKPNKDQSDVSKTESALRGGAEGLTLGFEPRIAGVAQAGYDKLTKDQKDSFSDLYEKYKQLEIAKNKAAKAANPKTYVGGQLAGGVATQLIPGLGIAKDASILGAAGKAAGIGALAGASQSPDLTDAKQVAQNATIPAALGGILGGGAQALSSLRNLPSESKLASDTIDSFKLGQNGENLTSSASAKDAAQKMLGLGNDIQESLADNGERLGKQINEVYENPANQALNLKPGMREKLGPIVDKLQQLMDSQTDPSRKQQVQALLDKITTPLSEDSEGLNPLQAREFRDTLSSQSAISKTASGEDPFARLTNQATSSASKIGQTLNEEVPGLAPLNAQSSANASAQDLLKTISPLFERENIKNQKQIAEIISNVNAKGLKQATAGEFVDALKQYATDSGNDQLAELITDKAPDIAKRFDLTQQIQKEGITLNPARLAKSTLVGGANLAGRTPGLNQAISGGATFATSEGQRLGTQALGKTIAQDIVPADEEQHALSSQEEKPEILPEPNKNKTVTLSQNLYAADPVQLKQVSQTLAQDPSLKMIAGQLDAAIDQNDNTKKNTLLFSLLQNPRARQLIYPSQEAEKAK